MIRLILIVVPFLLSGLEARAQQNTTEETAAQLNALADAYIKSLLDRTPEYATFYGISEDYHAEAMDNSPKALEKWQKSVDTLYASLQEIDGEDLAGHPAWITYGYLREALESDMANRICRRHLWNVTQYSGNHLIIPYILQRQPVGTDDHRKAAIERIKGYAGYFDQEISNLRDGLHMGYSVPRIVAERVIAQLDGILSMAGDQSPFYAPAARDSSAAFKSRWMGLLENTFFPALTRYRNFLKEEYLPAARTTTALASLPDGKACYEATLREHTSLELSPEAVHETGLRRMDQIHKEMLSIARRSFGTEDVAALLKELRTNPDYLYRSGEEILAVTDSAIARARKAMPDYFGRHPKAELAVVPFPEYEAPSAASGAYQPGDASGSRPGTYFINLYQPEKRPRAVTETVAFHETYPGHHYQVSLALERPAAHPITLFHSSNAFTEGWGLYSERLADEMNLFSSAIDRMGMLSEAAFRAARLVVDPGLHLLGWSREEAIDYMAAHTIEEYDQIVSEIDRYISTPGQSTAYMTGYNEIVALRRMAKSKLGPEFKLADFHDMLLADGGVTLPMLREKVNRWIESRMKGK